MQHRKALPPRLTAVRDELRTRRSARAARKNLQRELASYTTPAERLELDLILDRHDQDEVAEIRKIVARQRAA